MYAIVSVVVLVDLETAFLGILGFRPIYQISHRVFLGRRCSVVLIVVSLGSLWTGTPTMPNIASSIQHLSVCDSTSLSNLGRLVSGLGFLKLSL